MTPEPSQNRTLGRCVSIAVAAALALTGTGVAIAAPAAAASSGGTAAPAPRHAEHGKARWRFDASATTLDTVARITGADRLWAAGATGRGVGVALVDTGVVPITGLTSGNVDRGPDLSFESQASGLRHLDTAGHGTHLAGIVAGSDRAGFRGIAPGARLTSVKVAAADGAADVSQVIAAIDWVVAHRNDDPAHPIRVLNLAYGTDGTQDYRVDPLVHAVENAWRAGIVVVAAAGNGGAGARLTNPAYDPYVLAVGASDPEGTVSQSDDTVADFSSRGDASRRVDLVAPGRSIVSLRDPGSYLDEAYPSARVGQRFFKGSGTSQAAAVVSGAVALLLQQRPELSPDQVKAVLTGSARHLPRADADGRGAGGLDVAKAARTPAGRAAVQSWQPSTGLGSLEGARGSAHVHDGVAPLTGENDIFGPFATAAWAPASSAGTAWNGGRWMGNDWTGDRWEDAGTDDPAWSGHTWSGHTWSGHTWSGHTWSGHTWSGHTWSGHTWSGHTWSGHTWSGHTWSGHTWSGHTWSGHVWSGHVWN